MIAIKDAAKLLPKVGDIRKEKMTLTDTIVSIPAQRCVVVEVNEERLWYRVRFDSTGTCECYKWPVRRRAAEEESNATP
jgi:hypothetical protein